MSLSKIRSHEVLESSNLLSQFESAIKQLLADPDPAVTATLPDDLRKTLNQLQQVALLSNSMKFKIGHIGYRLWYALIAAFNQPSSSTFSNEHRVNLHQICADLFFLSVDSIDKPSSVYKSAGFYCRTGQMWLHFQKRELAATCCKTATNLVLERNFNEISERWAIQLLIDLARIAWEVLDRSIATTLLSRAKDCLLAVPNYPYKALVNQYLMFASGTNNFHETSELMNHALDVCQKCQKCGVMTTPEEIAELEAVTLHIHLQMGEYPRVIERVSDLRKLNDDDSVFASFAVKAHLELGNVNEAERELKQMVFSIAEDISMSTIDTYFQLAQAQTSKGVYLGLLELCNSAMPLKEVVLLRTLVTILYRENGCELEALKLLKQACARATELGPDPFYGDGDGVSEQIKYSLISQNLWRKCWIQEKYELCIEFCRLVTEFNGDDQALVCKCLIWTVASMISLRQQKKISLTKIEMKQAVELLDKAAKMLPSISSRTTLVDDYKCMARSFRLLITNGYSDGDFVYDMCQRVYQVMEGLRRGESYPIEEGRWIFWTAMQQAKVSYNLGKKKCFKRWTSIGFKLARWVPGIDIVLGKLTYKALALQPDNYLNRKRKSFSQQPEYESERCTRSKSRKEVQSRNED